MADPVPTPTPEPAPARPQPAPPQVVVNVGGFRFQRAVCWLGWLGFSVCLMVVIGQSLALQDYFDTSEGLEEKFFSGEKYASDKVAILNVSGTIMDGSGFVKQQIDRIRDDEKVKAIVVRIVSPGGTITGSDYIYHHLKKLREERKIPLVVSMGSIAASGGYYVAMAVGDQEKSLYAEPTTTTGSIGVIIPHYDITALLTRFDIKDDSLASHPNKQMLSMTRSLTDEQRKILQTYLGEAFTRFKGIVQSGRPLFRQDPQRLDQLATGEIFTADQAKKHGLIDEIGFIEDAVDRAIELAKLDKKKVRVVELKRPMQLLELPFVSEARGGRLDMAALLELNTPQAYYLATTLPVLLSHRRPEL